MKKKTFDLIIKFIIFLIILTGSYTAYDTYYSEDTIKIANWNLQIFGESKIANSELMDFYADKINDYDIIFIQEIRDNSQIAFPRLCSMLQNYSCKSSSRAGRSASKEQYGVIYKNGINLTLFKDYNSDLADRWERPPIKTIFDINGYRLVIYNIHVKPDDVQSELDYLEDLVLDNGNVIILGDLNADCSYYNNEKETEFDDWNWLIEDDKDTTVSATDCAYDRIILNSDALEEYKSSGIEKSGITKDVSDHYLVWVEMEI